jgi:hypothetical protein
LFQLVSEAGASLLRPGYQAQRGLLRPVTACGETEGRVFFGGKGLARKKILPLLKEAGQIA